MIVPALLFSSALRCTCSASPLRPRTSGQKLQEFIHSFRSPLACYLSSALISYSLSSLPFVLQSCSQTRDTAACQEGGTRTLLHYARLLTLLPSRILTTPTLPRIPSCSRSSVVPSRSRINPLPRRAAPTPPHSPIKIILTCLPPLKTLLSGLTRTQPVAGCPARPSDPKCQYSTPMKAQRAPHLHCPAEGRGSPLNTCPSEWAHDPVLDPASSRCILTC